MKKVSVLVLQYNSEWNSLSRTILSAIKQIGVEVEVVISDDGSANNRFPEVKQLFAAEGFSNYKLVALEQNGGTVKNVINGLKACSYELVKLISPGDYLYSGTTLQEWTNHFVASQSKISFGDAVYYKDTGKIEVISTFHDPVNLSVYRNRASTYIKQLNYLCLVDQVLGAACLVDRDHMLRYLAKIVDAVVYGEDQAYRLMCYEGICFDYYPGIVIWYEYGSGVSTSNNEKWKDRMKNDFTQCERIMLSMEPQNRGAKRYCLFQKLNAKYSSNRGIRLALKALIFPDLMYWKMKKKCFPAVTPTGEEVDYTFINAIRQERS